MTLPPNRSPRFEQVLPRSSYRPVLRFLRATTVVGVPSRVDMKSRSALHSGSRLLSSTLTRALSLSQLAPPVHCTRLSPPPPREVPPAFRSTSKPWYCFFRMMLTTPAIGWQPYTADEPPL